MYHPDRYVPMMEAGLNLVVSIVLANRIGLLGVLIGTLVSFCMFSFWTKPNFVCRDVFGVPFTTYVVWEGKKIGIAFFLGWVIFAGSNLLSIGNTYLDFICKAIFALAASNLLLAVIFRKTDEFGYIMSFVSGIMAKCRRMLARQ